MFRKLIIILIFISVIILSSSAQVIVKPKANVITTYTHSTKKTCDENGRCNVILYSGTMFGYENGWKPIEELVSFKNSTNIECIVKIDGDLKAECIDYNATAIKVRLTPSQSIISKESIIPIKIVDKYNGSDVKQIINQDFDEENIIEKWFNVMMDESLHFGENSTTIILQDANTENLDDSYVAKNTPTTVCGAYQYLQVVDRYTNGYTNRGYHKFDTSDLPESYTIDDAKLCIYVYSSGVTYDVSVHHVYDDAWVEESITWNNQPCGTGLDLNDSSQCNLTEETHITGMTASTWEVFDVDGILINDASSNDKVSFVIKATSEDPIHYTQGRWYSKEYGTTALRPYLNITYTEAASDSCTCPGAGNAWEVDMSDYCKLTEACTVASISLINTGEFDCDAALTVTGTTSIELAADQKIWINSSCVWTYG